MSSVDKLGINPIIAVSKPDSQYNDKEKNAPDVSIRSDFDHDETTQTILEVMQGLVEHSKIDDIDVTDNKADSGGDNLDASKPSGDSKNDNTKIKENVLTIHMPANLASSIIFH